MRNFFITQKMFSRFSDSLYQAIIHSWWLFSDYIIRFLVVGITTSMIARYLGPTQFGLYNYALSFAAMITFFTPLGMQGLQMSRYSKTEMDSDDISIFFSLRILASVFATFLTVFVAFIVVKDSAVKNMLIALSLGTIFQVYENLDSFYVAKNKIQLVVILKLIPFIVFSLIKMLAVYLQASLWVFTLIQSLEMAMLFVLYYVHFARNWEIKIRFIFPKEKIVQILKTTFPMVIVAAAVLIQTRLDQIIIGALISQEGAGYYSAAYRIAELVNFIPIVLHSAVIGQVLQTFHRDEAAFDSNLQQLYRVMLIIMLLLCGGVSLFAPIFIYLFFGNAFAPAALVLSVLVWAKLFSSLRVVKDIYITAKGYYKYFMLSFLAGTLLSVLMNVAAFLLHANIVWFAFSAVVSQAVTFLSVDFFIHDMKPHAHLTVKSLLSFWKVHILFRDAEYVSNGKSQL